MARCFIPKPACTVASGDCFTAGRCIARCQPRLSAADANARLGESLRLLREIRDYTLMFRSLTGYVDGSGIDNAMRAAGRILKDFGA